MVHTFKHIYKFELLFNTVNIMHKIKVATDNFDGKNVMT